MRIGFTKRFTTRLRAMSKYNNGQDTSPFYGMTDRQLVAACLDKGWPSRGYVSWIHWESETYSHGRIFREWARYPRIFPLFFSSDHGVSRWSIFWQREQETKYKDYLTWNYKKYLSYRKIVDKKIHYVPHPWTFYYQTQKVCKSSPRKGTLVFFPHSTQDIEVKFHSIERYLNELKNLDPKYHPIVICLSHHDIKKDLHIQLRKYNLPLITLGNATERDFVDNFYNVLSKFKYASSSVIGSQVYFAINAGVPYFILGEVPEYYKVNELGEHVPFYSRDLIPQNVILDKQEVAEYAHLLDMLREKRDFIDEEVKKIADKYLGLEKQTSRRRVMWIIWASLFKNIHRLPKFYFTEIISFIKHRISKE